MEKELVCIGCPLGCNLSVTMEDGKVIKVTGNTCPRGASYAEKELTDPRRIITSSVKVEGGHLNSVSVKTSTDVPKGKIMDCIKELKEVCLQAPVTIGQIIVEDIAGTGVSVVATKNIYK